ncbi:MAG: S41 family peptidase [Bacteroidia bacterium]
MNYRYPLFLLFLGLTLAFAQQNCPDPEEPARKIPAELASEGFEMSMAKGPFLLAKSGRYAYLRVENFSNIFLLWDETLVEMMDNLSSTEGLILDLRSSGGDDMDLAYKLASCFIDDKQTGHPGFDFNGEHKRSHTLRPHPKMKAPFTAPVVVLTNRRTRNVAEIATLVLSQFDQVTLLGSPTAGSINPGPDGRQHSSATLVSFEDRGIPVDVMMHDEKAMFSEALGLLRGTFIPKAVDDEKLKR